MPLPRLTILKRDELISTIAARISRVNCEREIDILEAGCGRRWLFDLHGLPYKLTGVDLDKHALEFRRSREKDLHEIIIADLRDVALPADAYDVIYSSYVLEHIEGAEGVLHNFLKWVKPGGLIIITIPDRDSVHGFITRITPHWFHMLYYRHVQGIQDAGKPGHGPYRTVYDEVVSRRGIRAFALSNNLEILEERGFRDIGGFVGLFTKCVYFLSFGRLASDHTDLLYILKDHNPT